MEERRTKHIYICPLCGFGGYNTKNEFINHMKTFHPDKSEDEIRKILNDTKKIEVPAL